MPNKIDHVFVLMLENRSFDHLLGLSGIKGIVPPPGLLPGADDQLTQDPKHEFADVARQVNGGKMDGFKASSGRVAMQGVDRTGIPVIAQLASRFLLMDNWFSSMPGPTWPNRLFAHAASSGGLAGSPKLSDVWTALHDPNRSVQFDGGHIFDRFIVAGEPWRVYKSDQLPLVLALKGMVEANLAGQFGDIRSFASDVASPAYAPKYTFIEPAYNASSEFKFGNSHHPWGSLLAGDALVGLVYNALRKSPLWESSVLVVTWDEHGGFFDHVAPVPRTPPGDRPLNAHLGQPQNYAFDGTGVRVPALLISPWMPNDLGSRIFPGQSFDHASIVSSLREHFPRIDAKGPLTARDRDAPTWLSGLLPKLRTDPLASIKVQKPTPPVVPAAARTPSAEPSGTMIGVAQIAMHVDWALASQTGMAPLSASMFETHLQDVSIVLAAKAPAKRAMVDAHRTLLDYIAAVDKRSIAFQKARRKAAGASGNQAASPR